MRGRVQVLVEGGQAAVWCLGLTGATGAEAPGVVLRGVGPAELVTTGPSCGALIGSGWCLGKAPTPLLLLQHGDFLTRRSKNDLKPSMQ